MRTLLLITCVALAACEAGTEELGPGEGADAGIDAGVDVGLDVGIDAGIEGMCTVVDDCPSEGSPRCYNPPCRCGCYTYCSSRRCTTICDDGAHCGADAGVVPPDAAISVDAAVPDAGNECERIDQCTADQITQGCLGTDMPSCAFGACVTDCAISRVCELNGACVSCEDQAGTVLMGCPVCITLRLETAQVQDSTCVIGEDVQFTLEQNCSYLAEFSGASMTTGRLVPLDTGNFYAELDQFASPCLVSMAPTGALRTVWACPGCSFTVLHF